MTFYISFLIYIPSFGTITWISNMVYMTHFFYNFICYTQSQKIRKPCNLKTFDSKKTNLSRKRKQEICGYKYIETYACHDIVDIQQKFKVPNISVN
jgi:hypothetical protein